MATATATTAGFAGGPAPPLPGWVRKMLPGAWVRLESVWVAEVTLTPEAAQAVLDGHNCSNRPLSEGNAREIARAITAGRWVMTGEPLIFDAEGQGHSMQHRCRAVVLSGVPVRTLAVWGVSPDVFRWVDSGKSKSVGDRLATRGVPNYTITASCCGILSYFLVSGRFTRSLPWRLHVETVEEMLADWPSIAASVQLASESRGGAGVFRGPSPMAALHWAFSKADAALADGLFRGILDHSLPAAARWDGARLLAKRINDQNAEKLSPDATMLLTVRAWNAVYSAEPLKQLKLDERVAYPRVAGWDYGKGGVPARPPAEAPGPAGPGAA
jgi:hypothetical protein